MEFVKGTSAKISLVSWTSNAPYLLVAFCDAYKGNYQQGNKALEMNQVVLAEAIRDMKNTKLRTPLEMIHFVFLLNDVSRTFTHQLVRYRIGTSFVQQSMRFLGEPGVFKVRVPEDIEQNSTELDLYATSATSSIESYLNLLEMGCDSQTARGVLPSGILTNMYFGTSLLTLMNIYNQRMCCQAEKGEWQYIIQYMKYHIDFALGPDIASFLTAPYELGQPCGYRASFDRPCVWDKKGKKND